MCSGNGASAPQPCLRRGSASLCSLAAAAEHSSALLCLPPWAGARREGESRWELGLVRLSCVGSLMKHRSHHPAKREETCPVLFALKREGVMVTDSPFPAVSSLDAALCWRRRRRRIRVVIHTLMV